MIGPLVPAEVDLRDFPFMPIEVNRLLSSETWMLGTGDEKAAAMTLWMRSWHESPAGSLPSNERMLENLAQCKTWKRSRAHALRGWEKATDGRLYHPVVAEKVLEAWLDKLDWRMSGAKGNAKRWNIHFDPEPFEFQIRVAFGMLLALDAESKSLRKPSRVAIWSASPPDPQSSPPEAQASPSESPPESPGDRNRSEVNGKGYLLGAAHPQPVDNSTRGANTPLNGKAPKPEPGWKTDADKTLRYASRLGVKANPGESLGQVVAKCEDAAADWTRRQREASH